MTSVQVTLLVDGPPEDLQRVAERIGVIPTYLSPVVGQAPKKLMARWQHPSKDADVERTSDMVVDQLALLSKLGDPVELPQSLYVQMSIGLFGVKETGSLLFIDQNVISELNRWRCRIAIDAYP